MVFNILYISGVCKVNGILTIYVKCIWNKISTIKLEARLPYVRAAGGDGNPLFKAEKTELNRERARALTFLIPFIIIQFIILIGTPCCFLMVIM
jgi:hypothetical protein